MLEHITLLLPFLVSLFWTILFFFDRKRNNRPQNIWAMAMVLITVTMGVGAFYWNANENYSLFYKLDIIESFTTLSFVPVIFLYFRELTGGNGKWTKAKTGLLFLPAILFTAVSIFAYVYLGEERAAAFSQSMIENQGNLEEGILPDSILIHSLHLIVNEYTYSLVLLIQIVAVIIYAVRRLFLYRRRLDDFFSDRDGKDMKHHWSVFGGVLAFLVLTLITIGLGYTLYTEYHTTVAIVTFLHATVLYYTCYHVSYSYYTAQSFQEETVIPFNEPEVLPDDNDTEGKNNIHLKFLPKFNQVIDEDRLFLQKGLRIDDLANAVGTNRTYISRILKDEYHCSFWELINRKRIEYAKEQALQNPDYTVENLFELCGFSHSTAFSRAFHQVEGMTFRDWQKNR